MRGARLGTLGLLLGDFEDLGDFGTFRLGLNLQRLRPGTGTAAMQQELELGQGPRAASA